MTETHDLRNQWYDEPVQYENHMTEKEQIQNQIQELQEKLRKLEEVENEKMEFKDEGRFHYFHYNGKPYQRLEYTVIPYVLWFESLSTLEYPIPVYEEVMNSKLKKKLEELYQKQIVPEEPEHSMTNCVITGNPPDGYVTWQEWYNELGSKGILHNLRISSIEQEVVKQKDDYPYKKYTPEETEQSLKEAFVKAQQTEKWKEIQKLIDEEDNDKNFKNSLELIKEWGEKNKPPTLYQLLWKWWEDTFTVNSDLSAEESIDDLVNIIDNEFIPPSSKTNTYEWEKCLKIMREKLR